MDCNEILNWPHFIVPADDARVQLLFERMNGSFVTRAWNFTDKDGGEYQVPIVYFGSLLVSGTEEDSPRGGAALLETLGMDKSQTVRLDYALMESTAYLLRLGETGQAPTSFDELTAQTLSAADEHIRRFLSRPYAEITLERSTRIADEEVLFEGEEEFFEGFLGDDGLPLKVTAKRDSEINEVSDAFTSFPMPVDKERLD